MIAKPRGLILVLVAGITALAADRYPQAPYPEGYRQWTFLHGTVLGPQQGIFARQACEAPCTSGVMYFYGNVTAMEGFRTGAFANGSILANETLELHGAEDGGAVEGPMRRVAVMVKDQKLYAQTGGWGYAEFLGGAKVDGTTKEQKIACFECHGKVKDKDYVYTAYEDR